MEDSAMHTMRQLEHAFGAFGEWLENACKVADMLSAEFYRITAWNTRQQAKARQRSQRNSLHRKRVQHGRQHPTY